MCTLPICAPVSSCNVADAWTGASATIRVIAHEVNTIAKTIAQTWAAFAGPIYTVFRVSTLTAAVATVVGITCQVTADMVATTGGKVQQTAADSIVAHS